MSKEITYVKVEVYSGDELVDAIEGSGIYGVVDGVRDGQGKQLLGLGVASPIDLFRIVELLRELAAKLDAKFPPEASALLSLLAADKKSKQADEE